MHTKSIAVLIAVLAVAWALSGRKSDQRHTWLKHLSGWQKVSVPIAVVVIVLIALNPEIFALGVFSDAGVLEMMALGLSLQIHSVVARVARSSFAELRRGLRPLGIPSPGFIYLLAGLQFEFKERRASLWPSRRAPLAA